MTSPDAIVKEFKKTPFDLWSLRGKEFTIIDSIDRKTGSFREVRQMNKWDKPTDFFFIGVEQGLFQKDLRMTKTELQRLMIVIPESIPNLQGVRISVDMVDGPKYIGNVHQDTPVNNISSCMNNTPPAQTQAPIDQKEANVNRLVASMEAVNMIGTDLFSSDVMKIADKISPGNAVQLVGLAKSQGRISETEGGIWKVN